MGIMSTSPSDHSMYPKMIGIQRTEQLAQKVSRTRSIQTHTLQLQYTMLTSDEKIQQ